MTVNHSVFVDLSDLRAVRVECRTCRVALTFPLTETIRLPHACPNCGLGWVDRGNPALHTVAQDAIGAIKSLAQGLGEASPFAVRLELDERSLK